jgi:trehalose 6-phosphate phosphatase
MSPRTHKGSFASAYPRGDLHVRDLIFVTMMKMNFRSHTLRPEIQSQFAPFLKHLANASEAVLLLDYDGTLAPFQVKRDQAHMYPGVATVLQEIVRNRRTRVVVLSGRDANEVLLLLNIHPRPEVWGIHGLQRIKTDESLEMAEVDERTRNGLSNADRWLGYQRLRHTAEFKAGSIAVHWRGMSDFEIENLRSRVLLGWRPIAADSGLDLLAFDGGIEIRALGADKGDAVRTLLSEIKPTTPVAYLGDDTTDESAFQVLRDRGLSVLVRPAWRQTAAQFWLTPPDELLEFLGLWLQARSQHQGLNKGAAAAPAAVNE